MDADLNRSRNVVEEEALALGRWQFIPRKERQLIKINSFLVEAYKAVYYSKLRTQGIRLVTNLDETVPELFLFPDIYQVFVNLIDNAYDVLEEKKKKLGENFNPTLTLTTKNLVPQVEIIIEDNGEGISPEIEEKIFGSFFTTKPAGKGTGLGLAIAHDIVVGKHGGQIKLETKVEEYTRFIIILAKSGINENSFKKVN